MLLKRKTQSNLFYEGIEILEYRRRLRRMVINAAERFLKRSPQWDEYFFDVDFLVNRGLPIVEDHLAGTNSVAAIDIALTWAEKWPAMNASQRKVCLQAQTILAAELLRLVTEQMLQPYPTYQELAQLPDESWRGMSVPFAYVKAQNPPGRSDILQPQRLEVSAKQRKLLPAAA